MDRLKHRAHLPHSDFRNYLSVNIPRLALFGIALAFLAGCTTGSPTILSNSNGQSSETPYSQVDKPRENVISIAQMNSAVERLAREICPITHCDPKTIVEKTHVVDKSSPYGNMAETDPENNVTYFVGHPGYTDPSVGPNNMASAIVEEITHASAIPRNVDQKDGFIRGGVMKGFNYSYPGISPEEQRVNLEAEEISTRAIVLQISPIYSNPLFDRGGKSFLNFLKAHNISPAMLANIHHKSTPEKLAALIGLKDPRLGYWALVRTMYALNLSEPDKLFGKKIQPIESDDADKFLKSAYAEYGGK